MRPATKRLLDLKLIPVLRQPKPFLTSRTKCCSTPLVSRWEVRQTRYYASVPAVVTRKDSSGDQRDDNSGASQSVLKVFPSSRKVYTKETFSEDSFERQSFGKWQTLSMNHKALAVESKVVVGKLRHGRRRLLVDMPENSRDLALWACLLDYRERLHGEQGVREIWNGIWSRKSLTNVESPLAQPFWAKILETAVRSDDETFLQTVWIYAEWMREIHNVRWPEMYRTVLSHCLQSHQHRSSIRWHLHLSASFDPGHKAFADLLLQHATDQRLDDEGTLFDLYTLSPHNSLYDIVVPHLYNEGLLDLAQRWREACIQKNDLPVSQTRSIPFLRFMRGYLPHIDLTPEEIEVVKTNDPRKDDVEVTREFMNRVHAETFGITVKSYNDAFGARWLASRWVGLDTAIGVLSSLGVEAIGPLSLQSIAMREGSSQKLADRINSLRDLGISLSDSNYTTIILQVVDQRDDELLNDFLHWDLHPDCFNDLELQAKLLHSSLLSGDWRTCRLLLASKAYLLKGTTQDMANTVLTTHLEQRNHGSALRIIDDLKASSLGLSSESAKKVLKTILNPRQEDLDFCIALCRQLADMGIPIPVNVWRRTFIALGDGGRLDELETLCLEVISPVSLRPGFRPVHENDKPHSVTERNQKIRGMWGFYIPAETSTRLSAHPLNRLFDMRMVQRIVLWSFGSVLGFRSEHALLLPLKRDQPADFHIARGIRLLRVLRDHGVRIDRQWVRRAVTLRLAELFGTGTPMERRVATVRATNTLGLAKIKALVDEAWGKELLPDLETLYLLVDFRSHGQKDVWSRRQRERAKKSPWLSNTPGAPF